jgi:hypothetical protein
MKSLISLAVVVALACIAAVPASAVPVDNLPRPVAHVGRATRTALASADATLTYVYVLIGWGAAVALGASGLTGARSVTRRPSRGRADKGMTVSAPVCPLDAVRARRDCDVVGVGYGTALLERARPRGAPHASAAHAHRRLRMRLAQAGRLAVVVTARAIDPPGGTRRITRTRTVMRAG